ncbi:MAG: hypothetical protein IRZ00_18820, partial [Gemmatimonadetes bacterium]|nr:hypothetical protein [Gemmatimonadota bacterium]
MVRHLVRFLGAVAAFSFLAGPLHAQRVQARRGERALSVELSPYGGMMISSELVKGPLDSSVKPGMGEFWG